MTRRFGLGDILSVTTGRLVSPRHMDGLYDLLNFMTGDNLFTHQLPRAADECAPALIAQHPFLADIVPLGEFVDSAHAMRWLAEQIDQYGAEFDVTPLPESADHTVIDPFAELAMVAPHLQVIPVVLGDGDVTP